jgi:hypothetical protein
MDTAAGAISGARDNLRTMLSKCTYWQQFGGETCTESVALSRIYFDSMPHLETILSDPSRRPFAVIGRGSSGVRWRGTSGPRTYTVSGSLVIEFHRTPQSLHEDDYGDPEREYQNDIGRIVSPSSGTGLLQLSALDTNLDILDIHEDGPHRASPDVVHIVGDAFLYYLEIEWGTRG